MSAERTIGLANSGNVRPANKGASGTAGKKNGGAAGEKNGRAVGKKNGRAGVQMKSRTHELAEMRHNPDEIRRIFKRLVNVEEDPRVFLGKLAFDHHAVVDRIHARFFEVAFALGMRVRE